MDELPAPAWIPGAEADAWRRDVLAWTGGVLAGLGLETSGAPTVHKLAPWSVVLRLPTSAGTVPFGVTGGCCQTVAGSWTGLLTRSSWAQFCSANRIGNRPHVRHELRV